MGRREKSKKRATETKRAQNINNGEGRKNWWNERGREIRSNTEGHYSFLIHN